MALKPDRIELADGSRIKYFMNQVAERGGIVVLDDNSSGEGMDDPNSLVHMPSGQSGAAAGILMNDVVNLDLTRTHINWHKDEVQVGNKVAVLRRGYIRTNIVAGGDSPTAGDACYFTTSGVLTTATGSDQVGVFTSNKDAEGYVEVEISI